MADTHPNAYLTEAQEKRNQAAILISEAEALEAQAKAISGEEAPPEDDEPDSSPDNEEGEDDSEEQDLADASNTIEGDKGYDKNNPHRHGFGRKKK